MNLILNCIVFVNKESRCTKVTNPQKNLPGSPSIGESGSLPLSLAKSMMSLSSPVMSMISRRYPSLGSKSPGSTPLPPLPDLSQICLDQTTMDGLTPSTDSDSEESIILPRNWYNVC